jgi:metallo-beta-lactamase family protein
VEQSKAINDLKQPAIIMASSGMCTAGRIKHHLRQNIGRPESTIVFVGYQVRGTLGRQILDGNPEVRIHGRHWRVRARIEQIHGFSGHADRGALLRWLSAFKKPPRRLFLTHGEEEAALSLADRVRGQLGWEVEVPEYQQEVALG